MSKARPTHSGDSGDEAWDKPTVSAADRAEVEARMYGDLEESDLDRAYAKRMGYKAYTAAEMNAITKGAINVDCYLMPYPGLDGRPTGFWRAKLLDPIIHKDGGVQKYYQPPHSAPRIYLPPLHDALTWEHIASNPAIDLYFTEGEKKAAAGAKAGLRIAGIGGVWSFGAKKRQQLLLPDFAAFELEGRKAYLIFDSDTFVRADLMAGLVELANRLTRKGAQVYRIDLPQSDNGAKVGLDDYFVGGGTVDALRQLPTEMFALSAELISLNETYGVLHNPPGVILRREDNVIMARRDFELETSTRQITAWSSTGQPRQTAASEEWLKWKYRREFTQLVYTPRRWDEPRDLGDGSVNLWPGWGFQKPERDAEAVRLFLALIDHLTANSEPHLREWLLQWLAYPIVHPGAKLMTAVILHGLQGSGKTMLGYATGGVYGATNFSEIKQTELHGSFNSWSARKQFILADEIISSDRRADMAQVKSLITQDEVTVNEKYKPTYRLRDTANFLFASNSTTPLVLEADDRRFTVIRVQAKLPDDLRKSIGEMIRTETGRSGIAWYLFNKIDLASFDPYGDAPASYAKADLISDSRTELETFVDDLIANYDEMFSLGGKPPLRDFQPAESIAALFDREHENYTTHASPVAVGRILASRATRAKIYRCARPIKPKNSKWLRLYAFRNLEKWRKATDAQIAAHWDEAFDVKAPARKTSHATANGTVPNLEDARKKRASAANHDESVH